jgi:hypothetical protein
LPFIDQLFDVEQVVSQSALLQKTVEALNNTQSDKKIFAQVLYKNIADIDEMTFIKNFKISKEAFLEVLQNTIIKILLP